MAGGEQEKKGMVVLYPSPGMGHLVSMVELGKLIVSHGFSVTILIVKAHYNTGSTDPFIAHVSSINPSISFHTLQPPSSLPPNPSHHHEAHAYDLLRHTNPSLRAFLLSSSPCALIIDFFCIYSVDMVKELAIPCHCFFTCSASILAVFLNIPVLHESIPKNFSELGKTPVHIPGIPPFPADHMILPMLDREDEAYKGFLDTGLHLPDCDGIIVNTFEALEPRALEAITAGHCTLEGLQTPPIYCIGPLITEGRGNISTVDCIAWLDTQPKGSVVFLCFGSLGLLSAEQIKEIAIGLEKSGQRFLWVVRSPPSDNPAKYMVSPPEPDLDVLMPEGFLERTREQGLVVKSWAPQVEVLRHESVGGFVTHCGWNSILEGVVAGVPMVGWPQYAEQKLNIVILEKELKLAVAMRGYDEGFVPAEEVETRVRWLMESDGGMELRKRTLAAKDAAMAALQEGGSASSALARLVSEWTRPS
ncbi:UDP-glucuronosyl/UDP-glucosyltransferase protein [Dioscorea alata]|uniref:UDP-glucuronosyl/UDP-glucosyltransferase protein n=1 Tax=Dioscorea alata TaxID=55571 RepID=A0ACB7TR39_DIOAL|nr:UDP-glucuronosyl/UDP-glucosyltransferase protein [Dioscorea alata]